MPAIGISPCPPFIYKNLIPHVLYDGNTVAWYRYYINSTITKDGADRVSQWNDFLGSGNNLLQGVGANQPLWSVNSGLLFDGLNDSMLGVYAFNLPLTVYFVGSQITWTLNDVLYDGNTVDSIRVRQRPVANNVRAFGNAGESADLNMPALNTFFILRTIAQSGVNLSSLRINNGASVVYTSNLNPAGLRLSNAVNACNMHCKEIILRSIVDSAINQTSIYNYLKTINSVP